MSIYLNKSKIIILCLFPVIAIIFNLYALYSEISSCINGTNPFYLVNPYQVIEYFFIIVICILFSFYYVYVGFLFERIYKNNLYRTFTFLNIIWAFLQIILEVVGIIISSSLNINLISPIIGIIISICIITLQSINIYLVLNYNNVLKEESKKK
ncbi:hypothetical protein HMPREF1092_02064 [Clostridium thermobutyricum]|uniref:Uncharacterized protein n=1 Tax=Clostridium thermobutyricum TaxID=29372 RepID=N9WER9_9CLOT|nr:hypothetical protein HMPREF1092_02064 [Clostridium thermobutyricum]